MSATATHGRNTPNPVYPANLREYCRRLADTNGWTPYRIRKSLIGVVDPVPSEHTIRNWVDPDYYEAHLQRARRFRRPGYPGEKAWQLRRRRMRELRDDVRLSSEAIARLVAHDFGIVLSRWQVNTILDGTVREKTVRELLSK